MIALGQFLFRFRDGIFPLLILVGLLVARPHYSFGSLASDWLVDFAGLALILAGQTWIRVLEAEMTEPRWALILGVGLILLAAYLGVRVLKKQGVLRP